MATQRLTLTLVLVLALLAPGASQSLAQPAASPAAPASSAAPGAMLIVENAGQWPEAARFQVWNSPLGPGTTWLAEDAIWLVVASGRSQVASGRWQVAGSEGFAGPPADLQPANLPPATFHALKLTFPGSNPNVRIEPFGAVTTTVSYFLGSDPEQWHPAVPVWSEVRYVDLYPGIDLVLGATGAQLVAHPSADLDAVALRVEGADAATVDGDALRLSTAAGDVRMPLLYVDVAPAGSALVQARGQGAFEVDAPFASHSLQGVSRAPADDPGDLLYSTFLGGSSNDNGYAIAVDGAGSAYVAGQSYSDNFPTTPGAYDPSQNGNEDAFVVKLNPAGSGLAYATFMGGSDRDRASAIAVDGSDMAYVTGGTSSSNFPTTPGAFDTSLNGNGDAFVVKLNATGTGLNYATFLGGGGNDWGNGIAVDGMGRAYVTGNTVSSNFPTTPGAFDTSLNGNGDAFVVKLNATGTGLNYATFLGGGGGDSGNGIAVDGTGRAYVTGLTHSSDFPTPPGAFDPSFNGAYDAFVARLNAAGSGLDYGTFLGGGGNDWGNGIAVDGMGRAYVTGNTVSSDFPTTPGAFDPTYAGGTCGLPGSPYPCWDAFVAKLNAAGSGLDYAAFLGGSNDDHGADIAVDAMGRAYVTGGTRSSDFPSTPGALDPTFGGGVCGPNLLCSDAFVTRLNATGSGLDYATFLGGSSAGGDDSGKAIAVDWEGRIYVSGFAGSSDFPTTPGAFDASHNGSGDAFVAKLDIEPYTPNVLAPIEQPSAGAYVSGAVTLRGFAIDRASTTGTGVDMVHIYLDGPYGTGTIIGGATYGLDRPDIAAQYGERFRPSGWELAWNTTGLAPGVHWLYLYAHRTTDNAWSVMEPHLVIVPGGPARWLPIVLRQR